MQSEKAVCKDCKKVWKEEIEQLKKQNAKVAECSECGRILIYKMCECTFEKNIVFGTAAGQCIH